MKVDLNNLYLAKLVMLEGYNENHTKIYTTGVRNIVVYRSVFGNFYDLSTFKRYKLDLQADPYNDRIGKLFIDADCLTPLSSVLSFDEDKISRTKVLQKVKSSNIK